MVLRAAVLLGVLSACGRIGFAPLAGADGSGSSQTAERCNGLDDDGNGAIDEGCACTPFDVTLPDSIYGAGLAWLGTGYAVLTLATSASLTVVDETGVPVGTSPMPVIASSPVQPVELLAWTGSEIVAVWAAGPQIQLGRYSPAAAPIGPPVVVSTGGQAPSSPQIAWAGDRLVIMWSDRQQIEVREVGTDGAVIRQLQIPGLTSTQHIGSFALTRDRYAIVLSNSNATGPAQPDQLVVVDRAAWAASPQRSLAVSSTIGFPPTIVAGPDGTFAVMDPTPGTVYVQSRASDGSPLAPPVAVPSYATDFLAFASVAPFGTGHHVLAASFLNAWEASFDPVAGAYGPPVLRATALSSTLAPISVVTASGRQALALTYGPIGTTPSTRLLQSCP